MRSEFLTALVGDIGGVIGCHFSVTRERDGEICT